MYSIVYSIFILFFFQFFILLSCLPLFLFCIQQVCYSLHVIHSFTPFIHSSLAPLHVFLSWRIYLEEYISVFIHSRPLKEEWKLSIRQNLASFLPEDLQPFLVQGVGAKDLSKLWKACNHSCLTALVKFNQQASTSKLSVVCWIYLLIGSERRGLQKMIYHVIEMYHEKTRVV